jgi:L-galactose dehydrogenase
VGTQTTGRLQPGAVERRTLGRSGLQVSSLGLGTGGRSRIGMRHGATATEAADVVRRALELGVTYIDTAPAYGTEEAVGLGIRSVPRDQVTLSTKFRHIDDDQGGFRDAESLRRSVTRSLSVLGVDHVDILFLHGVLPDEYPYCSQELLPEMLRLREEGLVRALGVSESFANDPRHEMQHEALEDGAWDVFMTGFNLLNPSARSLFEAATQRGVGTVVMHAARWMLTSTDRLRCHLEGLATEQTDRQRERFDAALERLRIPDVQAAFPGLAYRYCLSATGVGSVLVGTGDAAHLHANVTAAGTSPDPADDPVLAELEGLLEGTTEGSGDEPRPD